MDESLPRGNDIEDEVVAYLRSGRVKRKKEIIKAVHEWLKDVPDQADEDYVLIPFSAGDAAYRYFRDAEEEISEIGVEIVEGDQPYSTYYVAELA